jgi:hypothetical protein
LRRACFYSLGANPQGCTLYAQSCQKSLARYPLPASFPAITWFPIATASAGFSLWAVMREKFMFGRVKPLDAILATAEKKSLHRSLGAFQLTMLGVGADHRYWHLCSYS